MVEKRAKTLENLIVEEQKKKKLFAREALREVMAAKGKKVTQLCLIHARSSRNEAGQTCLLC